MIDGKLINKYFDNHLIVIDNRLLCKNEFLICEELLLSFLVFGFQTVRQNKPFEDVTLELSN